MPLRNYQKKVLKNFPAGLFWEMRLGKTKVTHEYIKIHCLYPCLIVAPYSAFNSWQKEVQNIQDFSLLNVQRHRQDCFKLKRRTKYAFINKEGWKRFKTAPFWEQFRSIIVDESTFIKNPKAKVTKFFTGKVRNWVKHKFILTGTPNPESDLNFLAQLYFIEALDLNYWRFRFRYCYTQGFKWHINRAGRELLKCALKANCNFLSQCDENLQNDEERITREIIPDKKWLKIYNKLKEKFVLEYKVYKKETNQMTEQFLMMRKLCSGFIDDEMVFDFKFKELQYLLDTELKNQQVVIYCDYLIELFFVTKHLKSTDFICGKVEKDLRNKKIENFKNKKFQYLIVQPETVKYSSDFSFCNTIIYFSTPLGSESRKQSKSRIEMPYKKEKNLIIDLIIKNSIESDILYSLRRKDTRQKLIKRIVQKK